MLSLIMNIKNYVVYIAIIATFTITRNYYVTKHEAYVSDINSNIATIQYT